MTAINEKLAKILKDANLDGGVMMVFNAKDDKETPCMNWALGLNNMTQQEAIGGLLSCLGDALLQDCTVRLKEKLDPERNIDTIKPPHGKMIQPGGSPEDVPPCHPPGMHS